MTKSNKASIDGSEILKTNKVAAIMEDGDLAEWFLMDLLMRLPVKLIFRFKIVCKHWLSVISDPTFARMFISRASLQRMQSWVFVPHIMFLDRSKSSKFLESVKNRKIKHPNINLRLLPVGPPACKIRGISNGLVLSQIDADLKGTELVFNICNPVTGQWVALPPLTCKLNNVDSGFLTRVEDGMLKSYRVVCLELSSLTTKTPKFHVFISESGNWKDFSASSDSVSADLWVVQSSRPPFDFHGNLHWVLSKKRLLAYDPYLKPNELRIIKLPCNNDQEYNKPRDDRNSSLWGVSDGKLRFLELVGSNGQYQFSCCEIWILNDYSSEDWSLQSRISRDDIFYDPIHWGPKKCMFPISFDLVDSDIVYLGYHTVFYSFNFKTKRLEAHHDCPIVIGGCLDNDPYVHYYWYPCMLSLMFLIPPWPTSVPPPSFRSIEKL